MLNTNFCLRSPFQICLWTFMFKILFKCTNNAIMNQRLFLLPAATKLGQGNIFTGVCLSMGGRGVCLSACWDIPPQSRHPPEQTSPLGADTPPPPGSRPPWSRHTPPPGADTPRKQTSAYG